MWSCEMEIFVQAFFLSLQNIFAKKTKQKITLFEKSKHFKVILYLEDSQLKFSKDTSRCCKV